MGAPGAELGLALAGPPPEQEELDPAALIALETDRLARAQAARATLGISPAALALAFGDWWLHLAASPGKLVELQRKAARKLLRYGAWWSQAVQGKPCPNCIEPLEQDSRFRADAWQQWPFNAIYQGFLFWQQWWHNATTDVHGVSAHHAHVVNFTMRQILDIVSPSNFPWSNPEVLQATREQGGANLVTGAANFAEDWRREMLGQRPAGAEAFVPGVQVALTPGSVVMRNRLIELIQYAPSTPQVHPEPVLIVPAWIMKYYILDLSPENSLVKYLVDRGHTVFMISWKNPGPSERDLSMDDYLELGVMQALEAIGRIVPERKMHLAGYCLGGTLAAIAAALMARERDERVASLSLFAAQVDFAEAGELMLFIDNSEVSLLEDMMRAQGYLDTRQMAGAFQLLRSNDLIWSRRVREYLLGRRTPMNDLMAWNSDATRMPYRMHSGYLRRLFLDNELSSGHYEARERRVALTDINIPLFAVGTVRDHVAPWRSVYKAGLYTDCDMTFVLAAGGHNAGIVSEPGHAGRSYQLLARRHDEPYIDPDAWAEQAPRHEGSWWPEWHRWLAERSSPPGSAPCMGNAGAGLAPLAPAPGSYVLQH
jgi:polyhydroxyalkanoate synthase